MNLFLADKHLDVRAAIRCLLEDEHNLQVIGECASAADLLDQLAQTCPDVLLLDWELNGVSARDLLAQVWESCPRVKVIALSARPESREDALQAGVEAFASKGEPSDRLLAAIRALI